MWVETIQNSVFHIFSKADFWIVFSLKAFLAMQLAFKYGFMIESTNFFNVKLKLNYHKKVFFFAKNKKVGFQKNWHDKRGLSFFDFQLCY